MTNEVEHVSMCLFAIQIYIFFGEVSVQTFCPQTRLFVFLLLSYWILYSDSLFLIGLAIIFSQLVAWLLILLTVLFKEQRLTFSFMDIIFGGVTKKSWPNPRSQRFFSMLSCRSFIVVHLRPWPTLSWLLYMVQVMNQKIFCIWLSNGSSTIYLLNYVSTIHLNDYPFFIEFSWHLCQNSVVYVCVYVGLF